MKTRAITLATAAVGGAAVLAAGTLGWNLHRLIGKEPVSVAAPGKTAAESKILATLREMETTGKVHLEVPESDGRRLRVLAEAINAKNVVELGTSTGYSGLWLSIALLQTQGHLTTFEIDPRRAAMARDHFRTAGVDNAITLVEGDAHTKLRDLNWGFRRR